MIAHVQPVAHLHAVAIHRQRFARQGVGDHQRDELFREMERPVIVGTVGRQHRQAVRVVPGAHQVVAGGLAGAVGAVGLVDVRFGEGGGVGGQGAVDLVGGHVQEAEGGFVVGGQLAPVAARGFEQAEGADDVGGDEVFGTVDGAVDVAFGGKVDDGARAVFGQQAIHQRAVADVALHKAVAHIAFQRRQVGPVAGVGELVHIDHRLANARQPVKHEIAADETGATCDENHPKFLHRMRLATGCGAHRMPDRLFHAL